MVTVWRGLVIDPAMPKAAHQYVEEIRASGSPLGADGGKSGLMRGFRLAVPAIRSHELDPAEAAAKVVAAGPQTERDSELSAVCVCGDRGGAIHYATRSPGTGILLCAEVPLDRLVIDGRDFLYSAFSRLVKADGKTAAGYVSILKQSYSAILEQYVEVGRAFAHHVQLLFRLVDYVITDRRVIAAHLASRIRLFGRYNTAFRSAFGVVGGISASEVVQVSLAEPMSAGEEESLTESVRLSELMNAPEGAPPSKP